MSNNLVQMLLIAIVKRLPNSFADNLVSEVSVIR